MGKDSRLNLENIQMEEDGENYRFTIFPMIHKDEKIILYQESIEEKNRKEWTDSKEMVIGKEAIQKQTYAYVVKKKGEDTGTPVRILTKIPDVKQMLLLPGGKIRMAIKIDDDYSASAGLLVEAAVREERGRKVYLNRSACEFALAQAGIPDTEQDVIRFKIRFHTEDDNHSKVFGAPAMIDLVLNPPEIIGVIREESRIVLQLSAEPKTPLYARICSGSSMFHVMPCKKQTSETMVWEDRRSDTDAERQTGIYYEIAADCLNFSNGSYTVEIACQNKLDYSYWSSAVMLPTDRPVIERIRMEQNNRIIQMKDKGYYFWQGRYELTDKVEVAGKEIPEIRYVNKCDSVTCFSLPAKVPETAWNGFCLQDGYYRLADAGMLCSLQESYQDYENKSFKVEVKGKKASLVIKEKCGDTLRQDFKNLLSEVCTSYAGLEELTACFGHMPLKEKDMLRIRYGYDASQGICDLHAGMKLCLDYELYQNIPNGYSKDGKQGFSGQELSGFVGNGSSVFPCILRNGKIMFEPFAQGMSENGGMKVEGLRIQADGCVDMGAGIWDALFWQFPKPFVRLLCPADWKKSSSSNYGSTSCLDNVCLISADTYQDLEKATTQLHEKANIVNNVGYVCFRGRTAVRIMIHIFVEGQPQMCALGTTLGDISAAYGLGSRLHLERFCGGEHVPFLNVNMDIPLYIGDRVCRA